MVSPPQRKARKPAGSRKTGVAVQIRQNIPYNKKEVVTRTQVTRKVKNRVLTKSTTVKVPIVPPPLVLPDLFSSDHNDPQTVDEQARRGPSRSASSTLEQWLQYREEFADELIKHEAPYLGNQQSSCQDCGTPEALFRCLDCFAFGPACQDCTVHQHAHLIFHRIQKWNGSFFSDTSLFELGASFQLGHDVSEGCPLPSGPTDLTVLDFSGVHTVRITYCFCEDAGTDPSSRRCQLLRARLFPATWSRPGTAFTFRLLNFLHKLQTQSKVNLYDFYLSLVSVTDSAGQRPPVFRYNELSLVLRVWVHLRQVRRGGGAHIVGGFEALAPGSLAVECPACPHPEKNLVTPQVDSWLNTLYLSMDANFKLKQKERGFKDPPLSNGLAYMVSNEKLQRHLTHCLANGFVKEINTCGSNFNAVSQMYTKYAKGYAITGVGGVDCARHGFKRPLGVVDLQRGERYSNMDLALICSLAPSLRAGISRVLLSYDIGCQWHKNLPLRLASYDVSPPLHLANLKYWKVVVPKFHLPGHGTECQLLYNLAYVKWAGRMDGERIEAGWALTAPMATWTRESGPFARRGILDDHWSADNWRKLLGLRVTLDRNLLRSLAWSKSQREVANLISGSYTTDVVEKWHKMRDDFDRNSSMPNPYEEVENYCTMAELRLELLKEEVKQASSGGAVPPHKVSAGAFFRKAVEIEDRVRVLSVKTKAGVTTAHRHAEVLALRNAILRDLFELRQSQRIYMPGIASVLDDVRDNELPEDSFKLWLPSEISAEDRNTWCLPDIPFLEFRFRYAQADDSLAELRRLLRLSQGLRDQNVKHPSHSQKNVSRSQGLLGGFTARIQRNANRYSHARDMMLALDSGEKFRPGWMKRFQKLNEGDIRGPGREIRDTSEGRYIPSWIWLVPLSNFPPPTTTVTNAPMTTNDPSSLSGVEAATTSGEPAPANEAEIADSMRVHWAKCQARAERYEEEVALSLEEMGRTLRYFKWKQSWWLSLESKRANSDSPPSPDVRRGLRAYAHRQASIYETLIISFISRWRKSLLVHGLTPIWLSQYSDVADPLSSRPSRGHSKPKAESSADASNDGSAQTGPGLSPSAPQQTAEQVDVSLAGDTETDEEEDYVVDEVEGFDFDD